MTRPNALASAVVGATSLRQLEELLDAAEKGSLSDEVLDAIDEIHRRYPNPNP
jgi:aryl-alcohol dehydrogenase-like predicted oxidoreductase